MAIPLRYNIRNLIVRWRATAVTLACVALVVAVYIMTQSLAHGLQVAYISTGDPRNLIVLRKGSTAETNSLLTRSDFRIIKYLPGTETRGDHPMVSAEVIVLVNLEKRDGSGPTNALFRGVGEYGFELRPSVNLAAGRMFQPGRRECIASLRAAGRFKSCGLGETLQTGKAQWVVVGLFDAQKTAYDSEIWGDAEEAQEAFDREFYSSVLLRIASPEDGDRLTRAIEAERRLKVRAVPETAYYEEQTAAGKPLQVVGGLLAAIMAIGACFSAMNAMYAAVGNRSREIGTLRVLGFKRREIMLSFLIESALLALAGAFLGCLISLPLNGLATGTLNFLTFSEVAFEFRITPWLLLRGAAFGLLMGLIGGFLPARLAARKPILVALRSV